MGLEITRRSFTEEDRQLFGRRLDACMRALRALLARPGFGQGAITVGAELEMSLVDAEGHALPLNRAVLRETVDPRFTVELDRFNLECNLRHCELTGAPLAHLAREMDDGLAELGRAAAQHGGRVVPVGILPTLRADDLRGECMTDSGRYHVLATALRRLRDRPFEFHIHGRDSLDLTHEDVTFEGAATSLQLHLRIAPDRFRDTYNAAQLATGAVLSVAGNSPLFLGRRLWDETRIVLFKQAVDDRDAAGQQAHLPARVSLGDAWLRGDAADLFADSLDYTPLLPVCGSEDPLAVTAPALPALDELRTHQGTVWLWNRPVYDPGAGGHLRIELRALPAGPTVPDMLANTALLLGLVYYLRDHAPDWTERMPFALAEHNFYRAAERGLDARLYWPDARGEVGEPMPATTLLPRLLPLARRGLAAAGVDHADSEPYLEVIVERLRSGQTGARWQRQAFETLRDGGLDADAAACSMLERYVELVARAAPVHTWPTVTG